MQLCLLHVPLNNNHRAVPVLRVSYMVGRGAQREDIGSSTIGRRKALRATSRCWCYCDCCAKVRESLFSHYRYCCAVPCWSRYWTCTSPSSALDGNNIMYPGIVVGTRCVCVQTRCRGATRIFTEDREYHRGCVRGPGRVLCLCTQEQPNNSQETDTME